MMEITEKSINEACNLLIKNEWEYDDDQVKFGIEVGFAKGVEFTNERLKAEREKEIINFAKWYSGMTEDKVKSAYKRYLSESQLPKIVDDNPLTECMMGRDSECNHPKCPVTDEDEKNGMYCTLPLYDYRQ